MKKNYEAPSLEIITYSLHEAIAATCGLKIYPNSGSADTTGTCIDPVLSGVTFSGDSDSTCEIKAIGYCYTTISMTIANS